MALHLVGANVKGCCELPDRPAHLPRPPSTASMLGTTSLNCFSRSGPLHSASATARRSSSASASSAEPPRYSPLPCARPFAYASSACPHEMRPGLL